MKIIWHGHACFELVTDEGSLVLDPYAKGYVRGLRLPPLCADAVLCSHSHSDHNAAELVELTGKAPGFKLERIPSWHDDCCGRKRGENMITVIEAEDMRVCHLGDLGHELSSEQLDAIGKTDILMIPVGGVYTVDAPTAKRVAEAIAPTVTVPMHYRGKGVGLRIIAPCDDFTSLFPEDVVQYLSTNELTVSKPAVPSVTVFAWPE